MDPKEVLEETHHDFYRYISNAFDKPRFTYHFRTDAPMDIRALFYVPESRPGLIFICFIFIDLICYYPAHFKNSPLCHLEQQ